MDCQVTLSPLALDDLEKIVRYIALDDPSAAGRLGKLLLDTAESLCRLPRRGGSVRQRPGVKKLIVRPYLIFYCFDEATHRIEILRFWHGARDQRRLRL